MQFFTDLYPWCYPTLTFCSLYFKFRASLWLSWEDSNCYLDCNSLCSYLHNLISFILYFPGVRISNLMKECFFSHIFMIWFLSLRKNKTDLCYYLNTRSGRKGTYVCPVCHPESEVSKFNSPNVLYFDVFQFFLKFVIAKSACIAVIIFRNDYNMLTVYVIYLLTCKIFNFCFHWC